MEDWLIDKTCICHYEDCVDYGHCVLARTGAMVPNLEATVFVIRKGQHVNVKVRCRSYRPTTAKVELTQEDLLKLKAIPPEHVFVGGVTAGEAREKDNEND